MLKSFLSLFLVFGLALSLPAHAGTLLKHNNYVVFNLKGDCTQEDCMAVTKQSLMELQDVLLAFDLAPLASHQTADYKTVLITFRDYKTAPYTEVMQKFSDLGYTVVSYVIHDTTNGKDVIIPH